eukprot:GCRY01003794.1.p1 GENE.GCRY01003794.1~~GCRY01003794.1.p1  ORF type:complete len:299 (+),score=75.96 GCRY01003794.1:132-1028(+)
MGERKVLNKYYPPDFDPLKIPRLHLGKDRQFTVRMMMPMTGKCTNCGEYMPAGKKFNSKCERSGERYLGINILRFYMRCPNCHAEFTIKTDPENSDYTCEHGVIRGYEMWNDQKESLEDELAREMGEDDGDVMKALEKRTQDSKREMDVLDQLDELQAMSARKENINLDDVLEEGYKAQALEKAREEEEDDKLVQQVEFKRGKIKRIADTAPNNTAAEGLTSTPPSENKESKAGPLDLLQSVTIKRKRQKSEKPDSKKGKHKKKKRKEDSTTTPGPAADPTPNPLSAIGALSQYSDSE